MLNTASWNAHSVCNKIQELQRFICSHDLKLIFLSETWLNDKSNFFIPHFDCYRVDRQYGGVAILIHKTIPHSFHKQISLDYGEAIYIKLHDSRFDITICSVYCSPAATRAQAHSFFSKVFSVTGPSVIAGDFNSKHHSWNANKNCRKGTDLNRLCSDRGFHIHPPNGPTLIPPVGAPSTVDSVVSKLLFGISDPLVVNDLSSDHCPIKFNLPLNTTPVNIKTFCFKKAHWKNFKSQLILSASVLEEKFPILSSASVIDSCVDAISKEISSAMDKTIPKKLPFSFRYPYSKEIHMLTKSRNRYRKLFLQSGNPSFRTMTNLIGNVIKMKTQEINRKSLDEKIGSLNVKDCSLFKFAKTLKNKRLGCPPLVSLLRTDQLLTLR